MQPVSGNRWLGSEPSGGDGLKTADALTELTLEAAREWLFGLIPGRCWVC